MEKFRLANALGDHMVLQREADVRIWGKGKNEGDVIYAVLGAYESYGIVDRNLNWELYLPPMPANTSPQTLVVSDGENRVICEDVLIGDVWIINGQSNAEASLAACNHNGNGIYDEDLDSLTPEDNIRALLQARVHATNHPESMLKPQFDMCQPEDSSWRDLATAPNKLSVSAMAFFFARYISRTLNGSVPIGIVQAASGGSPMMELIMPELVEPMNYTKPEKEEIPLAGIYNALMAPVQKMTIKGMLFYQGESEQWRHKKYAYQLKWYVEELRRRFDIDFPFYYVQLSSHIKDAVTGWPRIEEVRYTQTKMLDILDNAYMVVSMDVGGREDNPDWAHPPYKKPVGERLALAALANEYGIGDPEYKQSPVPCCWRFDEDSVTVHFDNVGDGLKILKGEKLVGFEAQGEDGKYKKVRARIISDDTVVFKGVKNATALRYAYMHDASWDAANLGSSTDLPCVAFEVYKDDGEYFLR
jgi:sialate O-acetylesterase